MMNRVQGLLETCTGKGDDGAQPKAQKQGGMNHFRILQFEK